MAEEKKKSPSSKSPQPISRRDFALGSVAMLAACSLVASEQLPPLSAEAQTMKLDIAEGLLNAMEASHILEEDIRRVIDHAEKTGEKLYQPGKDLFLSKLRLNEVYFYAEYSPVESGFRLHDAYAHRFLLGED